jgi:hypothetical protein
VKTKGVLVTLSAGDLTAAFVSPDVSYQVGDITVRATIGKTRGKWYWEVQTTKVADNTAIGIINGDATLASGLDAAYVATGDTVYDVMIHTVVRSSVVGASPTLTFASGCAYGAGDVMGIALDMDSRVIYFSLNGLWQDGGDPENGAGGIAIALAAGASAYPAVEVTHADVLTANFGQNSFDFAPPHGFEPLHD